MAIFTARLNIDKKLHTRQQNLHFTMLLNITHFGLWTASNLTGWTSNSLKPSFVNQTSNPSKKTKLRTCSARNVPNPGPNPEKPNFEPFRIQVRLPKLNYQPIQTLQKSRTSNPQTEFGPTLSMTQWVILNKVVQKISHFELSITLELLTNFSDFSGWIY